jgi:hypothetical protein
MLLKHRPRRVVEIGSGYSSACAMDTVFGRRDMPTQLTFIEPYPDLLFSLMRPGDRERVQVIPQPVQQAPLDIFEGLDAGDILFVDSTHVAKTGSDVCFEWFEIFPRLKPGVLIHVHDVFYPFEYPRLWVVDEGRSWNEIYMLRALLMYSDAFAIVFFNDYFARKERDLIAETAPAFLNNTGSGFWMRRIAP